MNTCHTFLCLIKKDFAIIVIYGTINKITIFCNIRGIKLIKKRDNYELGPKASYSEC